VWRLVIAVLVVACGAPAPGARRATSARTDGLDSDAKLAGTEQLVAATASGDASKVARLLHPGLTYAGMWFADAGCRLQFGAAGTIRPAGLQPLASCLAGIRLMPSDRRNPVPDIAVFTYEPGIEIEVLFAREDGDVKVRWIGYVSRRELKDALPTVTQRELEAHRSEPTVLGDAARSQLEAESSSLGVESASAWLKVCIGIDGSVTSVHPRQASSPLANKLLQAFVQQWRFRPFVLGDQPMPVCSMVLIESPAAKRDRPFPFPVTDANAFVLDARFMNRRRTEGETMLVPRDLDKMAIQRSGVSRLVSVVQYCIDTSGTVASTAMIRSSRLASYDRTIVNGIRKWRFQPVLVDGVAVPACSHVVLVYSQR
jgi:hypothetical protein